MARECKSAYLPALSSSTKVTRLISCKVEIPLKTFCKADSRKLVRPFGLGRAPDLGTRPPLDNHFADIIRQIQQFVNSSSTTITGVVTGVATDVHIERLVTI